MFEIKRKIKFFFPVIKGLQKYLVKIKYEIR